MRVEPVLRYYLYRRGNHSGGLAPFAAYLRGKVAQDLRKVRAAQSTFGIVYGIGLNHHIGNSFAYEGFLEIGCYLQYEVRLVGLHQRHGFLRAVGYLHQFEVARRLDLADQSGRHGAMVLVHHRDVDILDLEIGRPGQDNDHHDRHTHHHPGDDRIPPDLFKLFFYQVFYHLIPVFS